MIERDDVLIKIRNDFPTTYIHTRLHQSWYTLRVDLVTMARQVYIGRRGKKR